MKMIPNMKSSTKRKMHYSLAFLWLLAFPAIIFMGLLNSVPLLVFISVYANVAGHWAAAEAAVEDEV